MLERLHGAIRSLRPVTAPAAEPVAEPDPFATPWWDPGADASVSPETDSIEVHGVPVAKGSRVRLRPGVRRSDAQDIFLDGRVARVEAVLFDVEDHGYLAVTLEDDLAADMLQRHGRLPVLRTRRGRAAGGGRVSPRVLVAGVGNVFLGDDGFGVEVARRLVGEAFPEGVQVADFGIRGVHLAYELLDGYDLLILVDAAPRGEAPGTVFVLEPDFGGSDGVARGDSGFLLDAHSLDPEVVLGILADLGGTVGRVVIVGCEPAEVVERMGLSAPVSHAVDEAARVVRELIARACVETSTAAPEDAAKRREAP